MSFELEDGISRLGFWVFVQDRSLMSGCFSYCEVPSHESGDPPLAARSEGGLFCHLHPIFMETRGLEGVDGGGPMEGAKGWFEGLGREEGSRRRGMEEL